MDVVRGDSRAVPMASCPDARAKPNREQHRTNPDRGMVQDNRTVLFRVKITPGKGGQGSVQAGGD